jgi:hypothetical protein
LKVLGTDVGNNKEFFKENWDGMQDDILIKLEKWKPFARGLSLRGRPLVVNLLSASKLGHFEQQIFRKIKTSMIFLVIHYI